MLSTAVTAPVAASAISLSTTAAVWSGRDDIRLVVVSSRAAETHVCVVCGVLWNRKVDKSCVLVVENKTSVFRGENTFSNRQWQ